MNDADVMQYQNPTYGNFHRGPNRAGFIFVFVFTLLLAIVPSTRLNAEVLTLEQWIDLGWDYYNTGNIEEAFNTFIQAVEDYPESAEAHLALGEIYLEMDVPDRARNEILESLRLDDETAVAARAHYVYATLICKEDPWNALLHLDRAHRLGGTPNLQFEIAHKISFCHNIIRMPMHSQSGPVILHYAEYLLSQADGDRLSERAEHSLYLAENFCSFDLVEDFHIFIYPSERAVRAEILLEEDDNDPVHREFHMAYEPELDFLPQISRQLITDLQDNLNRHGGAEWVARALPNAVTGTIAWEKIEDNNSVLLYVDVDAAVRALCSEGALIDLTYLIPGEFDDYIPDPVFRAELGSFLRWIQESYDTVKFLEIITQPNLDIVLDEDIEVIQNMWLEDVINSASLISDPELTGEWALAQPLSPIAGDPEMPTRMLKEGLRLYLNGEVINGIWQIRQALMINPGLGLGYYTLGWIAVDQQNWDDAEQKLTMAASLFESPVEISWCHTMLAPIYLYSTRWTLAHASLNYVYSYTESNSVRNWAAGLLARTTHILALRPDPIDTASPEYAAMVDFFGTVDESLNAGNSIESLASELMDETNKTMLVGFYDEIQNLTNSVVCSHEIINVGVSGSSLYVELRLHAEFPTIRPALDARFAPLATGGYLFYFQVMPTENGWAILDWEDGWFPIASSQQYVPQSPDLDFENPDNENPGDDET